MRHVILGCLLFLAACGGDLRRSPAAVPESDAAARQGVVISTGGQDLMKTYAALVGPDRLVFCLRGWFGESASGDSSSQRPVYKPDLDGFRDFLCDCASKGQNCP